MKLVIVGGTAAGMSAAARARRHDEHAEIVIFEHQRHVSSASCGLPYFLGGEISDPSALTVQTPASLRASLSLDVRTEHEVIALDPAAKTVTVRSSAATELVGYDALVLAPGAQPTRPPIAGLDSPRVRSLRTVEDALSVNDQLPACRRVVVLGAGFIGVEVAEALAARGLRVTLVEATDHVLPPLDAEIAAVAAAAVRALGIDLRTAVLAQRIEHGHDHDTVVLSDGSIVEAELIMLATGVRPATAVFERAGLSCERGAIVVDEHGRTNLPQVWAAGDATLATDAVTAQRRMIALAGPANRAGRQIADDIFTGAGADDSAPGAAAAGGTPLRQPRPIPSSLGTAIVRIGALTVAATGASRQSLQAAGREHHTIHLHPSQHAGYFPGASPIALLVHFAPDGTLLGAQAAGADGVDKRIDVLATAIRARMKIADLIDLDLAYSPPYGHAKDPLNLAGMIGENVLDGQLSLWYAQDLEHERAGALLLDVRSRAEFAAGHLPDALNVPHTELRARLPEVQTAAAGRPVRVLCGTGMRSYIAHRVLVAHGLRSASLSGGMATLTALLPTAAVSQPAAAVPDPASAIARPTEVTR